MAVAAVALLAMFFMVPQTWVLVRPLLLHARQTIDANLPVLVTGFLFALGASLLSWLFSLRPRHDEAQAYRVVRRFRI